MADIPSLLQPPVTDDLHTTAYVFERKRGDKTVLLLLLGIACFVWAVVGFFLALRTDADAFRLQMLTTLPVMAGMALVGRAWLGRVPFSLVTVDEVGVTVTAADGPRTFAWNEIAWNAESSQPLTNVLRCTLYGTDGKVLVRIPAVFERFDVLVVLINRRINSQPIAAADPVRRARLKRQSLLLIPFGVIALTGSVFLVITDREDRRRNELLATQSKSGMATIERKFLAPDGRTKRVEYRVAASRPDGGRPELVNIELEPSVWDVISEGQKVPVLYVPADPDVSRFVFGERPDNTRLAPPMQIVVEVLLFGLGLLFLTVGGLNLRGIDLVIDSETKRLRVSRGVSH